MTDQAWDCPKGRKPFLTEEHALAARTDESVPYRCVHCRQWHNFYPYDYEGRCPVERKVSYMTEDAAQQAVEVLPRMRGGSGFEGMHTYHCAAGPHWHAGHALTYANWTNRQRYARLDGRAAGR